uniref:Reverse transcriptase zinc-binding domain-containing protein n=1 Tax=Fagus sylvatica TaxID=28930 RepID=A0A2N9G3X1_FAGSY
MDLIYSLPLDGTGQDQLCWNKLEKRGFSVKSFYHCLNPPSLRFPWRGIWKSKVPPCVAFFTWTAVLGKLPSIDNLRKRNMVIVNRCCLCKNDAESVDHLFLHCKLAKELWDSVLSSFGVSWVMPCQVRMLVDCWQGGLGRQRNSLIWKVIPHCLMWCLWRERNLRSFEDLEMCSQDLKLFFFPDPY